MHQDNIKHDHALTSWVTLRVGRKGVTTTVLRIETDLSLNAEDLNYQKDAVDSLVEAMVAYVGDHPHIDTIEIERIRQGRLEVKHIGF